MKKIDIFFAFLFIWVGCKPKTPPDPNNEELITTVLLHVRDSSGVQPDTFFMYRDADGDGGSAPTQFDSIQLKKGNTYWVDLYLLDESKLPTDTISNEVMAESDEHLVCYSPNLVNLSIAILDKDGANLPLGLKTKWVANAQGVGSVQLVLRHQPGTKNGTCEPGSSDIDLNFGCRIQ